MARATPDPEYVLRGSDGPVTSLAFMDKHLISGSQQGSLFIWDLKTFRIVNHLKAHNGQSVIWIHLLDISQVLTQGRDGLIVVWNITSVSQWERQESFKCSALGFCPAACFALNGRKVLAMPTENNSDIEIVSMDTRETLLKLTPGLKNKKAYGMCMDIKPVTSEVDCSQLLAGYEDGRISLWDVNIGQELSCLMAHSESVMCLDYLFSDNNNVGFSGSVNKKLCMWTIQNSILHEIKDHDLTNDGLNCTRIRKDGKIVAGAGWDSQIRIFSVKKLRPLAILNFHKGSIQTLAFASNGLLAAGSRDTSISLWNVFR